MDHTPMRENKILILQSKDIQNYLCFNPWHKNKDMFLTYVLLDGSDGHVI